MKKEMADEKVVCIQGETKKLDSREDGKQSCILLKAHSKFTIAA